MNTPLRWKTVESCSPHERQFTTSHIDDLRRKFADTHVREVFLQSVLPTSGLNRPMHLLMNDHTYELSDDPKDNWIYHAWLGWLKLRNALQLEKRQGWSDLVHTFATIGTGPGIDALQAAVVFQANRIVMTDIQPSSVQIASQNFARNAMELLDRSQIQYCALEGSLCAPLEQHDIRPDVLYMNLPNIPGGQMDAVMNGMCSSTFVADETIDSVPELYKNYLLGLQYLALKEAKNTLAQSGSAVVNLGGRIPSTVVQQLFDACGLHYRELSTSFKRQTQPEEVVTGYAEAEDRNGVTFDFYDYEHAQNLLSGDAHQFLESCDDWKAMLEPAHCTAKQALEAWKGKKEVGHLVQVLRAVS